VVWLKDDCVIHWRNRLSIQECSKMPSFASWLIRDASGEYSPFKVPINNLTGANYATNLGLITALQNALLAITLGNIASRAIAAEQTDINDTAVANQFAQRELKALVVYEGDTSGIKYTIEIPTFDPTGRMIAGTDLIDLTDTEVAAFVAAFEAIARTPNSDTETVTVLEMRLVGRNV